MSELCMQHIEAYWKKKTNIANQLFNENKYKEALLEYEEALYRAEVLNNHPLDSMKLGIPFVQIFTISCNNIAFTHEKMGQIEQCKKMLERVIYYLLHLSNNSDNVETKEIQNELKMSFLNYKHFSEKHNIQAEKRAKVLSNIFSQ